MQSYPMGTFAYAIQSYDTLWLIAQKYNTSVPTIASLNPGVDLNNLRIGQIIAVCPGYKHYTQNHNPPCTGISKAELDLNNKLRMLWEQHGIWTRQTILSMALDLPDVELVTNRLLQNPTDFAVVLAPLYGNKIASEFEDLLKSHLVIAAQLVKAAKAGDNKTAADEERKWYANADEIAALLGKINPYWSTDDWRKMLYEHLRLVKSEALAFLTKDYSSSIKIFDEIERQALMMADMMKEGIVKQFPDKFR